MRFLLRLARAGLSLKWLKMVFILLLPIGVDLGLFGEQLLAVLKDSARFKPFHV
jgi:hypothetical protein